MSGDHAIHIEHTFEKYCNEKGIAIIIGNVRSATEWENGAIVQRI